MPSKSDTRRFKFHGEGGTLFGIHLVNLFLILITLGIYSFWARVKVRKYIWGMMEFEEDRLSYHGTGGELLAGWLKAFVIFLIPYLALSQGPVLIHAGKVAMIVGALLGTILILAFIPVAIVGTRRYRLSRTAWRGIRFSFSKKGMDYVPIFLKGYFLTVITLGFYTPYFDMRSTEFMVSNTRVGSRNFGFDGKGSDLFGSFVIAILLMIPTLGFSLFWYFVKRKNYIWNHTTFDEARFSSTLTFGSYLGLELVNGLLVLLTLGFGFPWAQVRTMNFLMENLSLNGSVDFKAIEQEAQAVNATGEELGSFLDLDFDLG